MNSDKGYQSYKDAVLPSNSTTYSWDGTNSDLARQLFYRAKAGDSVSALDKFDIPQRVQDRLNNLQLDWNSLSGIAQRAVLWDSGFGISPDCHPVEMWALHGHSMADLAVPLAQIQYIGCQERACMQPDGTPSCTSPACTGSQMLQTARCVVQDFVDSSDPHTATWVTGGNSEAIPTPLIRKHAWKSSIDNNSYVVFAIHMIDDIYEPAWNQCARTDQNGGYGSLVLPCYSTANISQETKAGMGEVQGSAWVSRWLVEDFGKKPQTMHHVKLVALASVAAGVCFLVGLAGLVLFVKQMKHKKDHHDWVTAESAPSPKGTNESCKNSGNNKSNTSPTQFTDVTTEDTDTDRTTDSCPHVNKPSWQMSTTLESERTSDSNTIVEALFNSASLIGRRIPFGSLSFERALSSKGTGEVWLGVYRGQQVAIKKLLETDSHCANDPAQFVKEIELSASLTHPNIVSVFGVAWNDANSLVMVVEYYPTGNLQAYLAKNSDFLSAKHIIHIAIGIGLAVDHLHSRSPPLLHQGITSRNILLTKTLKAKLVGFRVTRNPQAHFMMTTGTGTTYWTAPEILEGARYTDKADIYSLGVVLLELDKSTANYDAAVSGEKKTFLIWVDVMAKSLHPSFSDECRQRIRRVSIACCQVDPAQRPTATDVVKMLKGIDIN